MTFCPSCGTEVEEETAFCPSCGTPIPGTRPSAKPPADVAEPEPRQERWTDLTEERTERRHPPPAPAPAGAGGPEVARGSRLSLPLTWPVTLSAWLIGVGAVVGAIAMFLPWTAFGADARYLSAWGLASSTNVVLFVALVLVAAAVFLSTVVPDFSARPALILVVLLIGLGVALDRLGIGGMAAGAVFFLLAMLAGSAGALLALLGHDRPLAVR